MKLSDFEWTFIAWMSLTKWLCCLESSQTFSIIASLNNNFSSPKVNLQHALEKPRWMHKFKNCNPPTPMLVNYTLGKGLHQKSSIPKTVLSLHRSTPCPEYIPAIQPSSCVSSASSHQQPVAGWIQVTACSFNWSWESFCSWQPSELGFLLFTWDDELWIILKTPAHYSI